MHVGATSSAVGVLFTAMIVSSRVPGSLGVLSDVPASNVGGDSTSDLSSVCGGSFLVAVAYSSC